MAPINKNIDSSLSQQTQDGTPWWADAKETALNVVKEHTLVGWQSAFVDSNKPLPQKYLDLSSSVLKHTPAVLFALAGGCGTDWKIEDVDGDGFTTATGDCWDSEYPIELDGVTFDISSAEVNPDAEETWYDGFDQNCDKQSDYDADGDGFTPDEYSGYTAANVADGIDRLPAGDCDDTSAEISPLATEFCDGLDNDCDGGVDVDAVDAVEFYQDYDGDGYGDVLSTLKSCDVPSGYVTNSDDCDDNDASLTPDTIWYADVDGDGFGDATVTQESCTRPTGFVDNADDCDDSNFDVNPGATEVCNGYDDNCDTFIDEDDSALDTSTLTTWAPDSDSDGYGNLDTSTHIEACFCSRFKLFRYNSLRYHRL